MFDLPTLTNSNLRDYRTFRKFLIKSGFMMLQESIYCKLVQNSSVANTVTDNIRKNKPPEGLVQVLSVTEKQFAKMAVIVGESKKDIIDTDERLIVL
ncbi:CRISPR-associated protein Cas2 [Lachnospiraceae bacterium KHCPX20]|nr:CRISPR-associated protein Cas2 [Lachnospiraceae bacterium KHCPX20]